MDKILYHGTFLTMAENRPEPEAVLIRDGVIGGTGTLEEMRKLAPDGMLRDMEGHTVLPGFIDGHSHLSAVAYQLLVANLKPSPLGPCNSVEDVVRELKGFLETHSLRPGQWLMGMGYDNSVFPEGAHPTKEDLDRVSTEIPVAAAHISGHLCVVNTKGMELLGYTGEHFKVPQGGVVEPAGLLKEQAFLGKNGEMQGPAPEDVVKAVGDASKLYASYGLTTVHDGKVPEGQYQLLKGAAAMGLLKNDVVMYLAPELADQLLTGPGPEALAAKGYEHHLRPAGVKLFLDGSPQGKTAWLSEPYYVVPDGEQPDYRGFPVQSEAYVMDVMRTCVKNRWQINVHANGDEAIEQMIRCYQSVLEETGSDRDLRPVVIHCQTVREDQLARMKEIGMVASFFLDYVYYWGDYHYESVLGPERAERISPARSALKHGVSFTLHQDSPVAPPDVMGAVHNAVNRKTEKGRVLGQEQTITVMEALKAVTLNGAYQIFEEDKKGSIEVGKTADFAVLERNPLTVPKEEIREIKVLETIKSGETIFRR